MPSPVRPRKGPRRVSTLVDATVRRAGQGRGFAEARLLTRWDEVAGAETAAVARPVRVRFGRSGSGAVLTLLTTGAHAPMLQMRLPALRERVNAIYGYAAIARIELTQTAPTGFAEGQAAFRPAPSAKAAPSPDAMRRARHDAAGVADDDLREALERLGANIISRSSGTRENR